jgi:hypothetical protein
LFDNLLRKHEDLLADALANPLKFETVSLALSTRRGDLLSPPKATFIDTELTEAGYLKWNALFENRLAGLSGPDEKIEARFYAPSGLQIASSWDEHLIDQAQRIVSFGSVALISEPNLIGPGDYKVSLSLGGHTLAEARFTVTEHQAAKEIGDARSLALKEWGAAKYGGNDALKIPSASEEPPSARSEETGETGDVPTLATGRISGLDGSSNIPMEIRLRPQPNGFLHGEMVISRGRLWSHSDPELYSRQPCRVPGALRRPDIELRRPAQCRSAQRHFLFHDHRRERYLEYRHQLSLAGGDPFAAAQLYLSCAIHAARPSRARREGVRSQHLLARSRNRA